MEPSILLADEPTGNLPTNQSDEILDIFEKLNKKGNTVLVITHEPEIAKRAKRMITLVDGKVVKDERIRK
jgi:ABC-type lipoprotein export system ATPase subunit